MRKLRDRLPPPNSLVVFEVASRLVSFTQAAAELNVTQAAVSRQMQLLEDHLGVSLFHRRHRSLLLTAYGEQLQRAVSIGLGHIAAAVDEIRADQEKADVAIASSVTFASYWLMARIAKFRAQHPDVDVRMVASAKVRDLASSQLDLAIRYGSGEWPQARATRLFGNDILAVCAPAYLQSHGPITGLADLERQTLLHLAQFDRNWVTWETWLAAFDTELAHGRRDLSFDNYMLLLHAAVRGEGMALCGVRLAEDFIARGDLVAPLDEALASDFSFYILHARDRPLSPSAQMMHDWLIAEAQGQPTKPAKASRQLSVPAGSARR